MTDLLLRPVGIVRSMLTDRSLAPDRPNPIGLHRVRLLETDGRRLRVGPLEAIDGTPVLDLKPVLRDEGG